MLVCSCQADESINAVSVNINGLIDIDLDKLEYGEQIPFDSLCSGYEYIVNQAGDTLQVSGWEYDVFDGCKHLAVGNVLKSTIKLYDSSGNFLNSIGKKDIDDHRPEFKDKIIFRMSPQKKIIYILANKHGKILKYSYDNQCLGSIDVLTTPILPGTQEEKLRGGAICDNISILPNENMLIHYAWWDGNQSLYNYCIMDDTGKILSTKKTGKAFNGKTELIGELKSYYYNNLLHVKDLSDTLYTIKENKFIPKYVFHSHLTLQKLIDTSHQYINVNNLKKDVGYKIVSINETDRYLFFLYRSLNGFLDSGYYCYLDKIKNKAFKICDYNNPCKFSPDSISIHAFTVNSFGAISIWPTKKGLIKLHLK